MVWNKLVLDTLKPFLDSNLDKSRIDKYVKEFEKMVLRWELSEDKNDGENDILR